MTPQIPHPPDDTQALILALHGQLRDDLSRLDRKMDAIGELDTRLTTVETKIALVEKVGWGGTMMSITALGTWIKHVLKP